MTEMLPRDERLVVAPRSGEPKERVFVVELAQYLNHRAVVIRKFARQRGLLHRVSIGACREAIHWLTPYGAARVIAYIRALQGDKYLQGKDYHHLAESIRTSSAKQRAKKTAQPFSIAFSEAGAEAQPSAEAARQGAPGGSGIAETPGCQD